MPPKVESCALGIDDLREEDGEFHLVTELNECRLGAIRLLLQGQSTADLSAFENAVEEHQAEGYELTSLIADLRCPAHEGIPKKWTCNVRPKTGAEPRKEGI